MANLKLTLACWTYDRTRALVDGTVKAEGIDLSFESAQQVGQIMERTVKTRDYDVAELGFTYYLRTMELSGAPFVAIPIFPNRIFRHAAIFVNRSRGIASPKDLAGRAVGELHRYGHDAGIWSKGVLADEYGVRADSMTYYVGPLDKPETRPDWAPFDPSPNLRIHHLGPGQALEAMLEAGEIDALFSAWLPQGLNRRSGNIVRLFPDYERVERDYYRCTGIFPIMHTMVIRRDVYEKNRWIARSLCTAFQQAKDIAQRQYRAAETFFGAPYMVPWLPALLEENRALMGEDPWPYGIEPNRKTLEAYLRYHYEQGLSKRLYKPEDIFVPETLG
jgi:ABC-type nitrate/sulfonate/bicarbonate transport system substrate-binding protein